MPIVVSKKFISNIDNNNKLNSAKEVSSTQEVSIFDEAKKTENNKLNETNFSSKDKNPEANFDRQTCLTLKISEQEWNKMSEDEKLKKNSEALKKIVDDYNRGPAGLARRLLKGEVTYASQYLTYAQRCSSPEEMARLTAVVKELDKENQYKAIVTDIEYKSEELKNVADYVIANDYTSYKEENAVVAVDKKIRNANEENQIIAAKNSTKVDTEYQLDTVKTFMTFDKEEVDVTIASQQGQYGIDKNGKKDAKVELNIFKAISKSRHEKALRKAAKNIEKLDSKNRNEAVKAIKNTKNENAIKSINTVNTTNETEKAVEAPVYTNDDLKLSQAIESNDKVAIAKCVNSMSETDLSKLISENLGTDLITKIVKSNPSRATMNTLNNVIAKSKKDMNLNPLKEQMIFLGSDVQIKMIQQAKNEGNLGSIKREFLNLSARREFDKIA